MARETDHGFLPGYDTDHEFKVKESTSRTTKLRSGPTACDAYLIHIYPIGPGMASRYILGNSELVLGRGGDCDIPVFDQAASRRHVRIEMRSDGYWVRDLDSTNGTFINNQRVTQARLNDGDNLRVGNHIFRFLLGSNVEINYHEEIYRLTIMDALTEIYNKRYLMEFLSRELVRSQRYRRPLSLILFDVDHFRDINENLGHVGGDFVLRELAARVRAVVRKDGLFARFGGEEFAVVLPETPLSGALIPAERIRERVAREPFNYDGKNQQVTVSLGVTYVPGGFAVAPEKFIQQADARLYQAKREGRNRVAADPVEEAPIAPPTDEAHEPSVPPTARSEEASASSS